MAKAIAILLAGMVLGGGVTFWLAGPPAGTDDGNGTGSLLDRVAGIAGRDRPRQTAAVSVAERLGTFRRVQTATDPAALEAEIARLASTPESAARDMEIDALITRLSDLSVERAAMLSLELGLPARFVIGAFGYWAERSPDAALEALARIGDMPLKRAAALELIELLGDDRSGLERVARVLGDYEAGRLEVDWLARLAERNPLVAFRDAEMLRDSRQRSRALERVGAAWAAQDPVGALGQAELLPNDLAIAYRQSVAYEWARLDPAGFLAYVGSGAADPDDVASGLQLMAESDPEAVWAVAESLPGDDGRMLRLEALGALVQRDPEIAMARIEAMPAGQDRLLMLQSFANRYAMDDPRAALEWARNLDPPVPDVMTGIVFGIGQSDPDLAVELMLDPPPGIDPRMLMSATTTAMGQDAERAADLADRMLASGSPLARSSLTEMLSRWASQDQENAIGWLLANADAIDAATISGVAGQLARRDPAAAAAYADRLPAELRENWIVQVAGPYANYDPDGAVNWLARYQGTGVHDRAFRQIIVQTAQRDPRRAADLLGGANPDVQLGAAAQVAMLWARAEPSAAVEWAAGLDDARARAAAVRTAMPVLVQSDPGAARRLTLELERGAVRDEALRPLVARLISTGDLDRALLDEFSSERARQEAIAAAIPSIWNSDRDEARALRDLVTDAATRGALDERIAQIEALGN